MLKNRIKTEIIDYFVITIGLFLYALGWAAFLLPYEISSGGLIGICAIIYYCTGFEIQYTYFAVNSILLLFAIRILGIKFCVKTIYGVAMLSFILWWLQNWFRDDAGVLPQILGPNQEFMACIIGSAMCGLGIAQVFIHQGTTGGTDIIAAIVRKYKNVSMGRMLLYCDIVIVSSCYFIFHDWKKVVFGFVVMLILTTVADYVMNYAHQSEQFFIISKKWEDIAKAILTDVDRGVTLIDGKGCYSEQPVKILLCVVKRYQAIEIYRQVKEIDPDAFISQTKAAGVFGKGFDEIKV